MVLSRFVLALLIGATVFTAEAGRGVKPLTIAQKEARNETDAPGVLAQAHDAERITSFLTDVLMFTCSSTRAYTLAQHKAILLATTSVDTFYAQYEYRVAIWRVLATSQLDTYVALCRRQSGTMFPSIGGEVVQR